MAMAPPRIRNRIASQPGQDHMLPASLTGLVFLASHSSTLGSKEKTPQQEGRGPALAATSPSAECQPALPTCSLRQLRTQKIGAVQ